jgi:hypothetical protein
MRHPVSWVMSVYVAARCRHWWPPIYAICNFVKWLLGAYSVGKLQNLESRKFRYQTKMAKTKSKMGVTSSWRHQDHNGSKLAVPRPKFLNPSVRRGNFRAKGKCGVFQQNKPRADLMGMLLLEQIDGRLKGTDNPNRKSTPIDLSQSEV